MRRLAVAARDVEHVGRLAEAGDAPAQGRDEGLALLDGEAEMGRAGGEVRVVQVVGLDPASPRRRASGPTRVSTSSLTPRRSTVWLTMAMPASIEPCAGGARRRRQLARVVRVQRDVGRLAAGLQRRDEIGIDPLGLDHRHPGVEADDPAHARSPRGARRSRARRRGESTSGSPPVRITSQISRSAGDVGERPGRAPPAARVPSPCGPTISRRKQNRQ